MGMTRLGKKLCGRCLADYYIVVDLYTNKKNGTATKNHLDIYQVYI